VIIDNQTPYLIHLAASRDERMPKHKGVAFFAHLLSPYPTLPPHTLLVLALPARRSENGKAAEAAGTLYWFARKSLPGVDQACLLCGWDGHALCVPAVAVLGYRG